MNAKKGLIFLCMGAMNVFSVPPPLGDDEAGDERFGVVAYKEVYPVVFLYVRDGEKGETLDWIDILDSGFDAVGVSKDVLIFKYVTIQDFGESWFVSFHKEGNGRLVNRDTGQVARLHMANSSVAVYLDKENLSVVEPPCDGYRWMPMMDQNPTRLNVGNRVPLMTPDGYRNPGLERNSSAPDSQKQAP